MSELSYMEKLLDGVEVEWKTLDDVVEFRRGSFPQPYGDSNWYDGKDSMPFVQVADVSDEGFSLHKKTKHQISVLAQPKSVFVETGTVIVSLQGTIGRVAITQYDCYMDRTLAIFTNYKADINKKYFAYQLKTKFDIEKKYARGSTLKTITKAEFSKFQIPIPPLNIQAEIVRILDAFTELTAELTAELVARKQQYAYYREKLLTFEEGEVEWELLGDVTVYEQPTKYLVKTKEYNDKFRTPVLTAGKTFILGYTNETQGINKASENPVIIFDDFTTANKWVNFDFKVKSSAMKMIKSVDETKVMQKYIYYWLNTLPNELTDGDHKRHWISNFAKKEIPVPPLAEQQRIVSILDKFDALTTSLTEGLPREIELRQQQYEYYRELLLNFPKPEVANHD